MSTTIVNFQPELDRLRSQINELVQKSGQGARAFRAVFRAIYAGQLCANTREHISLNSLVAPGKGRA